MSSFFLVASKKIRPKNKVWHNVGPVCRNKFANFIKNLAQSIDSLVGKKITNKSRQGVGNTRLNNQLVFIEKPMETSGHKSVDVFKNYNQEQKSISEKVTQRILFGKLKDGQLILCFDAYKEEFDKLETKVLAQDWIL